MDQKQQFSIQQDLAKILHQVKADCDKVIAELDKQEDKDFDYKTAIDSFESIEGGLVASSCMPL